MIASVFAALLLSLPAVPAHAAETVVAQAPATITQRVTDTAGVLSDEDKDAIDAAILAHQQAHQELVYIVFTTDTQGLSAEEYARLIVDVRGRNTAVMAVDPVARDLGVFAGAEVAASADELFEAAYDYLAVDDWAGAANAVVEQASAAAQRLSSTDASGDSANSPSSDNSPSPWLLGAGVALLGGTGGALAYSRRRQNRSTEASLAAARDIDPKDTAALNQLSTDVLEELAAEELVSTDESIRRGKAELDLATAEFGPERTRTFTAAMNHSTATLRKAFELNQQLESAPSSGPQALSEGQRRAILVQIISSCGQADDALDERAAEFAQMRDVLLNAPSLLDQLTQRSVDQRARLPQARTTLEQLRQRHTPEVLSSIEHNPELARGAVEEAESAISAGRKLSAAPAGQQGGLVAAIRAAEHALEVGDRMLSAIENAENAIASARTDLSALIAEVEAEISEAQQLEQRGRSHGTPADWQSLDAIRTQAQDLVNQARRTGEQDPLGAYTALVAIDSQLDEALDTVREVSADFERQLNLYQQQSSAASTQIQAAEDLISSRGRLIGSAARTSLAEAKQYHAEALYAVGLLQRGEQAAANTATLRQATAAARAAADAAGRALAQAKRDIDKEQQRQQARNSSGSGDLVTGLILGSLFSGGGSSGGFGGGFGGGSFGGGSFGGGFGGGGGFSAGGSGRGGAF